MSVIESYPEGIYRKGKDGEIILGKALPVFIHNGDFHLANLKIFQDGKIDCWGGLIDFDEFQRRVMSGWVRTRIPSGSDVSIFPLGRFVLPSEINHVEEGELIKEVRNIIDSFNGSLTTFQVCRSSYKKYLKNPTEENRIELKNTYEQIPKHNRCAVLGDMNVKDYPIQAVIYTDAELRLLYKGEEYLLKYFKEESEVDECL